MTQEASKLLEPFSMSIIPEDLRDLIKDSPYRRNIQQEIFKLGQELVSIRDNKALVQQIISTANRITRAEGGAIFLLEKDNKPSDFTLKASRNLTTEQIEQDSFKASRQMIECVASTGKGEIQEMEYSKNMEFLEDEAIRSRIGVPMILRNEVVGVLYHQNRLLNSVIKNEDLEILTIFAAQAALALDNAAAYQKIKRLNQRLEKEKEYYEEEHRQEFDFNEIIGESEAIKQVMRQTNLVAKTDTAVLIVGETGVGKELIARALHHKSYRKSKSFIKVNTSALSKDLIPSELFGHEKGAFTGALHKRIGRFELADEGTLFMDEIGEIPMEVQIGLLRVLQSKEFERVGGDKTIKSDFRLIAATNRDLLREVKKERFRSDLYYRINVFPIIVPALRERKEDIPLLANHFLKIFSAKMGKNFKRIHTDEIKKLVQYDWPGNIRELKNVIERGTILNSGPSYYVPDLVTDAQSSNNGLSPFEKIVSIEENERRHIISALQECSWKVRGPRGAAELLNINASTLFFRMKKLGIKRFQNA
jgi:transcriptional regulator with GAF, ATPase, and Fis domain